MVGHEEPVCEEVEGCSDPHEVYGKRSAQFGFPGWTSFSIEIFSTSFWFPRFRFLGRYFAKIDRFPGAGHPGYGYHEAPCVKHKVRRHNDNDDNHKDDSNNRKT